MRFQSVLLAAQFIAADFAGVKAGKGCETKEAQSATAFTLLYGSPLVAYAQYSSALAALPTNFLFSQRTLSTSSTTVVVRPNVDTLYSVLSYDLSSYDLSITAPKFDDGRFHVFPFYDPFGNNFANIGSVQNNTPGTYLLRHAGFYEPGLSLAKCSANASNATYAGTVYSPTSYGILLVRIVLKNNTTDSAIVHALQDQILVTQVNRTEPYYGPQAPKLVNSAIAANLTGSAFQTIMELTARVAAYNPPEYQRDRLSVDQNLLAAGIRKGIYSPLYGVNLNLAGLSAQSAVTSWTANPNSFQRLSRQWSIISRQQSGNFGSHYAARAYVAAKLYLQLTPDQALYPFFNPTSTSTSQGATPAIQIQPGEAYILTFSGKPPLSSSGFWSLTLYDSAGYLIPNALGRYSLGDRSSLTYPNGKLVYGSYSTTKSHSFQILLQSADTPPPKNWTNNWLPTPSGGGNFTMNLRLYAPEDATWNGSYKYPVAVTVPAVVA